MKTLIAILVLLFAWVQPVLAFLLEPLHRWFMRTWVFYGAPDDELTRMLEKTSGEVKDFILTQKTLTDELRQRMLELEQKGAHKPNGTSGDDRNRIADICGKDAGFELMAAGRTKDARVLIDGGLQIKAAIVNPNAGAANPFSVADRLNAIITTAERRLTIRDLIPIARATSNSVEFPQEASFTNAATNQGGPTSPTGNGEGSLKAESSFTFTLGTAPVTTLAHFAVASKQVLSDSALLATFLQNRMIYGLKLEEERQILLGNSSNGELGGLCTAATAYNRGATNQTLIDALANARTQLELADYVPDGVVLNPVDFLTIATAKDSQNRYLFGDPRSGTPPAIWNMPVIVSNSMTVGKFLMGMFSQAAMLWDREEAAVEFSSSHSDFFQRNLVAVRCEERLALTVLRTNALIYGNTAVQL